MTRSPTVVGICALVVCGLAWSGAKVASSSNAAPIGDGVGTVAPSATEVASPSDDSANVVRDFIVLDTPIQARTNGADSEGAGADKPVWEAVTPVRLGEGRVIRAGEMIPVGATVVRGVIRNKGSHAIDVRDESDTWRVARGDVVIVRTTSSCSTTCPAGSFACCNTVDGTTDCGCRTAPAACQSGGLGATMCSVSFTD